jgi:hypothetical protein
MPTTTAGQAAALSSEEKDFADHAIAAHSGAPGALLGILEYVAEKTDIPRPIAAFRCAR